MYTVQCTYQDLGEFNSDSLTTRGFSVAFLQMLMCQGPLMRLQIESYLDDNPDFTESYVLRKVGRKTIEKWLQLHAGI